MPTAADPDHRDAFAPFERERLALTPSGSAPIDIHTHLGKDEDGRSLAPEQLLSLLDQAGVARAAVFPLNDPDRVPAFRAQNDQVLAWARDHPDRLIPFCRVDPAEGGVAEAERCLAAGARGIKLHPRAQRIDFFAQKEEVGALLRLAAEAKVPVLIHAGRGVEQGPEGLCELAEAHPETALILAHAAIWDQGLISRRLSDLPLLCYDTSCFHPLDVVSLLCTVPAERILFGSDPPYGRPAAALYLLLRAARYVGLPEGRLRLVLAGNADRLLASYSLPPKRDPAPPPPGSPLAAIRLATYLATAAGALFAGVPERAVENLKLALTVGDGRSDGLGELGGAVAAAVQAVEGGEARRGVELIHRLLAASLTTPASAD